MIRKLKVIVKEFLKYIGQINPNFLASSITFYLLFMIFPMLLLIRSLLSWLAIEPFNNYQNTISENIVNVLIMIISILWVSSKFVNALTISTDIIYKDIENRKGIKRRITAFILMVFFVLIIIIQLVMLLFFQYFLNNYLSNQTIILLISFILQFVLIVFTTGIVYKYIIPVKIKLRHTLLMSSIVTIIWYLLTIGFKLINYYFGNQSYKNLYGVTSSLMLIILWMYFIVLIYLYMLIFNYFMLNNVKKNN